MKTSPHYPIEDVKEAIRSGYFRIDPEAYFEAREDFEWRQDDIEKFFMRLKKKHWHKSDNMRRKIPRNYAGRLPIILDIYHAENVLGENVYTHFYFEEDLLVIDSLHGLD